MESEKRLLTHIDLRILILYTYNKGFLSDFYYNISKELVNEGHEVINFSIKGHADDFIKDGINFNIAQRGNYYQNFYSVYTIIKHTKSDVIVSSFSYVNPALLFGKILGIKKNIAWIHSLNEQSGASLYQVKIKSIFLKLANIVIANSHITKKELQQSLNVPKHKIKVIPFWSRINEVESLSIDINETNSNIFKIGCPGRLEAHKNHKVVIEALTLIKHKIERKFRLYIAGEGREKKNLFRLIKSNKLEDYVEFVGHLSSNQMVAFYNEMDIIVLPSKHEAFGLVFIEALAMGAPVLVSEEFGALTFIDKGLSIEEFTFNPNSAKELAERLQYNATQPRSSGIKFKELYYKTFDKKIIFEKLKKLLLQ